MKHRSLLLIGLDGAGKTTMIKTYIKSTVLPSYHRWLRR